MFVALISSLGRGASRAYLSVS